MKKLIYILSAIGLVATGTIPTILNKTISTSQVNLVKNIIPIHLKDKLEWIAPGEKDFCLPCSIAMILNYYHIANLDQFEIQSVIHSSVLNAVPFLNQVLHNRLPNNYSYSLTNIPANFGRENDELVLLEQYVTQSIGRNVPIIFGYAQNSAAMGHAVVITGIEIDNINPNNTRYYINDPAEERTVAIFGTNMSSLLRYGGNFIGASDNFDFNKREVKAKSFTTKKSKWFGKIFGNFPDSLTEIVDLQAEAGITDFNQIKRMKYMVLDGMSSGFYYDGMKKEKGIDMFRNDNTFINGWSGWQYLSQFSASLNYGINSAYFDLWHATNFMTLDNGDFGGRISYRVSSSCSGVANYPNLNFDMGSEWDIFY